MESQQMMELLLKEIRANQAKTDANQAKADAGHKELLAKLNADRKTDREEILAKMDTNMKSGQEQIQENLKKIIEETMTTNQARTDVQLKELTVRIEKTQRELPSAEVSLCARTDKLQKDLTKTIMKPTQQLTKPNASSTPG
jgi:iron-sulfur cluster repair protein YtfE (RIC family)